MGRLRYRLVLDKIHHLRSVNELPIFIGAETTMTKEISIAYLTELTNLEGTAYQAAFDESKLSLAAQEASVEYIPVIFENACIVQKMRSSYGS